MPRRRRRRRRSSQRPPEQFPVDLLELELLNANVIGDDVERDVRIHEQIPQLVCGARRAEPSEAETLAGLFVNLLSPRLGLELAKLLVSDVERRVKVALRLEREPVPLAPERRAPAVFVHVDARRPRAHAARRLDAPEFFPRRALRRRVAAAHGEHARGVAFTETIDYVGEIARVDERELDPVTLAVLRDIFFVLDEVAEAPPRARDFDVFAIASKAPIIDQDRAPPLAPSPHGDREIVEVHVDDAHHDEHARAAKLFAPLVWDLAEAIDVAPMRAHDFPSEAHAPELEGLA